MYLWSNYRRYRAVPPVVTQFNAIRHNIPGQVLYVGNDVVRMSSIDLCHFVLYGKQNGSAFVTRII